MLELDCSLEEGLTEELEAEPLEEAEEEVPGLLLPPQEANKASNDIPRNSCFFCIYVSPIL